MEQAVPTHPSGHPGAALVEIIIAVGIVALLVAALSRMALDTYVSTGRAVDYAEATALASGGLEAVRGIAGRDWDLLVNGTHGIAVSGGLHVLSGEPDTYGPYTRAVTISDGRRNAQDMIVEAGGTADPTTRRVVSVVSWQPDGSTQTVSVTLVSYVTKWRGYASSQSSSAGASAPAMPPPPPGDGSSSAGASSPDTPPPPVPPPGGSCSSVAEGQPNPCETVL